MVEAIEQEFVRLGAVKIKVHLEERGPPETVRVQLGTRSCLLQSEGFLEMLRGLPDGAGDDGVRLAIEDNAQHGAAWAV